jgi:hypothetical protein
MFEYLARSSELKFFVSIQTSTNIFVPLPFLCLSFAFPLPFLCSLISLIFIKKRIMEPNCAFVTVRFGDINEEFHFDTWEDVFHCENFEKITMMRSADANMFPVGLPVSLVELNFGNSCIIKIENIEHLINLKVLTVSCTDIKKIEGLPSNLERFYAVETQLICVENLNEGLLIADFSENASHSLAIKELPASLVSLGAYLINRIDWLCPKHDSLKVHQ